MGSWGVAGFVSTRLITIQLRTFQFIPQGGRLKLVNIPISPWATSVVPCFWAIRTCKKQCTVCKTNVPEYLSPVSKGNWQKSVARWRQPKTPPPPLPRQMKMLMEATHRQNFSQLFEEWSLAYGQRPDAGMVWLPTQSFSIQRQSNRFTWVSNGFGDFLRVGSSKQSTPCHLTSYMGLSSMVLFTYYHWLKRL